MGVCSGRLKKGGLQCGPNSKKGVLGAGQVKKRWGHLSLRFPWNSMDSTAISMEYSDSISMENYAMASIECHGRGGILQNSMEVMELDLVEN